MLPTSIRHVCVCSILITLSVDIEKNPGPKPSSRDRFSVCHWNLSSFLAHNFIKISLSYVCIFQPTISTFYTNQKLILIQVFLALTTI